MNGENLRPGYRTTMKMIPFTVRVSTQICCLSKVVNASNVLGTENEQGSLNSYYLENDAFSW